MKKLFTLFTLVAIFSLTSTAQILNPVKWKVETKKVSEGVYDIYCVATVDASWHLYDTDLPEGGPLSTAFIIDEDETEGIELVGKFKATTKPAVEFSEAFGMELRYFKKTATFIQRVKLTKPTANLVGYVEYMACSGGQCIPPGEAEFEFELTK